jgi:hypothetical protein
MKNQLRMFMMLCLLVSGVAFLSSCDDDDEGPQLTGDKTEFNLSSVSNAAISGTVTLAKRTDNSTLVTIDLNGTSSGASHPAHIHGNSAAEGGGILVDLSAVDGATGMSETVVTALNDGTSITYDELIDIDGYVNVHLSGTDLATLVAQGDIGANALTGESESFALGSVSNPAISGTATFHERVSGETLVVLELEGTEASGVHPAHIHANTAAQGGGILIDLSDVDGATGISKTHVSELNDGTAITYEQLLDFNGYVNVHLSASNLGTLVAQGDIGQNELTGESKVYELGPKTDPTISGTATFEERANGTTLITIQLTGTVSGGSHPSHIHNNNATQGGPIALDLANVNGATGKSVTQVSQLNDGTAITYDGLIGYNGYINVHLSSTSLATLIAQGNIGSNAP